MKKLLGLLLVVGVTSTYAVAPLKEEPNQYLKVSPTYVIGSGFFEMVPYNIRAITGSQLSTEQCLAQNHHVVIHEQAGANSPAKIVVNGQETDSSFVPQLVTRINQNDILISGAAQHDYSVDGKKVVANAQVTFVADATTFERKGFFKDEYCSGNLIILPLNKKG